MIVAASAAGRWDRVRVYAAKLDFKLDGTQGVVDETWGMIRVRFFEGGQWVERFARRTGPATARIASLSWPDSVQHARDWVVFDPCPMEEVPEGEDPDEFLHLYNAVHVLQSGQFGDSALVDGAHPGDEQFAQLTGALDALGWEWKRGSGDDYTVTDPDTDEELKGIYFAVAAPSTVAPALIYEKLMQLTAGFEHPMCWPVLAENAGPRGDPAWHRDVSERYGL